MRIVDAHLHPYCLPLKCPWVAAAATLHERRGMLLALTASDGITGFGDCAPLPSSGATGHARVFDAVSTLARELSGAEIEAALDLSAAIDVPEVRWAVETALGDMEARRRGISLACHLGGRPVAAVAVNAALGALDMGVARAFDAIEKGFVIAKIKVGIRPVDAELMHLRRLHEETGGRLRLRLDANRAWSDTDAWRFLSGVAELPIDAVEEPLANPSVERLKALQAALPFAIAADESLLLLGADALLDAGTVRRLVIKPARIGGIAATRELAARAKASGVEVVLTSVVDSAVGVTAAAHLAAALAPDMAHGFATLDWLAADVATPPRFHAGKLILGDAPGLGFIPSEFTPSGFIPSL